MCNGRQDNKKEECSLAAEQHHDPETDVRQAVLRYNKASAHKRNHVKKFSRDLYLGDVKQSIQDVIVAV